MARVALINTFVALHLGTAHLAGMLRAHGHDWITIYLKQYRMRPMDNIGPYSMSRFAGISAGPRGRLDCWQTFEPISKKETDILLGLLKDYRIDLVGFSLTSSAIIEVLELTRLIRDKLSIPVIWGGMGPTVEPEEFVHHPDLLCIGEGERALLDVVEALEQGTQNFSEIQSIWGVENGTVFRNPPRPLVADLDELPFPRIDPEHNHFINENKLVSNVFPPLLNNVYAITTSRGCPFVCKYCPNSIFRRKFEGFSRVRKRSVSNVIEELVDATRKYDLKRVAFYDDVFGTNKKWVDEFAPRYKREIGLPFWCFMDPRLTDRDNLAKLNDAGLDAVELGIQSGSQRILKDVFNRNTPREQMLRSANILVDLGLDCVFDLLTYVKGETEEDCRETFDLLVDLPKELCLVGAGKLIYYPGYDITLDQETIEKSSMDPELYRYFHRLYHLTRTRIPRQAVRLMGSLPLFRKYPRLLDPFLSKHYRLPKAFRQML